jgi:UDP-3-O-[3-hydroxymyristoyl] N-acetylglucosamine deacetylase
VIRFSGQGLHTGRLVRMALRPAAAGHGIRFRRTDVTGADPVVAAQWDAVAAAPLCTTVVNADGTSVMTIEHLMAALAGCGVHNALVEIDGPEVPILDGSSRPFVKAILARGTRAQGAAVRAIRVLKAVAVQDGEAWARLEPAEMLQIAFHISFPDAAIGMQDKTLSLSNGAFVRELADSRTFCRKADVDRMRAEGRALGGSYGNAVVVDGDAVLTPGGLRHADEPVRHKMLDAMGDLALAGGPILGRYTGHRAGHTLTNRLLRALFADPEAFAWVEVGPAMGLKLPGVGVGAGDLRALA